MNTDLEKTGARHPIRKYSQAQAKKYVRLPLRCTTSSESHISKTQTQKWYLDFICVAITSHSLKSLPVFP
jgi:hypothetical protein